MDELYGLEKMRWYLVHTKPRQERTALQNLERQGYECYLPMLSVERLRQSTLTVVDEPLFPRYLFIRLGQGGEAKSWSPIRSTKGVCRLVSFGVEPAQVSETLVSMLRAREDAQHRYPESLFQSGEAVVIFAGPFAGLEGVFQEMEGERRAMVLIDFLCRPVKVPVQAKALRRLA